MEVPPYFVCPISMELMRDPATLCTGITYDRESIHKWLHIYGKNTCPVTMKPLHSRDLTPNHTLRRLIQGWRAANASAPIRPIPAPKPPPIDSARVHELLQRVLHSPHFQVIDALRKLRRLAEESQPNRRCIAAAGAADVLISVLEMFSAEIECSSFDGAKACEEALAILYDLVMNSSDAPSDGGEGNKFACNWKCMSSVAWILKRGTSRARFHAATLFHHVVIRAADRELLAGMGDADILEGLLELVADEVCHKATVSALESLMVVCRGSRRSRMKAIEAGAVHVLIQSLPETQRRSSLERMLGLLDVLCGCAEGRAAMIDHAMGIAAVSNCILRVSEVATEKAVRIVCSLCKFSPSAQVLEEMLQVGVAWKLCMVLQTQSTSDSKNRAKQVLRLNEGSWRSSPCIYYIRY